MQRGGVCMHWCITTPHTRTHVQPRLGVCARGRHNNSPCRLSPREEPAGKGGEQRINRFNEQQVTGGVEIRGKTEKKSVQQRRIREGRGG